MLEFLFIFLFSASLVVLSIGIYIFKQGDAKFDFLVHERTPFILQNISIDKAVFFCKIPFFNKGKQDGTLVDVYPRHLLPYEYYDGVYVSAYLTIESRPRKDGYWEAIIVPKNTGGILNLIIEFTAANKNISSTLSKMVDMPIEIIYQAVSRNRWYINKETFIMSTEEIKIALKCLDSAQQEEVKWTK